MIVFGRPFQPSVMFAGKARSLIKCSCKTFTRTYYTRLYRAKAQAVAEENLFGLVRSSLFKSEHRATDKDLGSSFIVNNLALSDENTLHLEHTKCLFSKYSIKHNVCASFILLHGQRMKYFSSISSASELADLATS